MSDKTKLILGLVGAAAVGVAIGILLAPETGADTRRKISDSASGWGDSLGDLFSSAKEKVGNAADSAKSKVGNLRRKGEKLAAQTDESYSDLRENYS